LLTARRRGLATAAAAAAAAAATEAIASLETQVSLQQRRAA